MMILMRNYKGELGEVRETVMTAFPPEGRFWGTRNPSLPLPPPAGLTSSWKGSYDSWKVEDTGDRDQLNTERTFR